MKLKQVMLFGGLIVALGAGPAAVAEDSHGQHHHAAAPHAADGHDDHGDAATLKLDHGRKWQTDAPLRKGMEGIREDLAAVLPAIRKGTLPAKQYDLLASKINGHVGYVVKNCKLAPEADAQLHIVLGQIAQGVEAMKSPEHRQQGAGEVAQALEAYGNHFQHPNWRALAH